MLQGQLSGYHPANVGVVGSFGAFYTINNQLRTEADKRNPTVYSKHSFVMAQTGVDTK